MADIQDDQLFVEVEIYLGGGGPVIRMESPSLVVELQQPFVWILVMADIQDSYQI